MWYPWKRTLPFLAPEAGGGDVGGSGGGEAAGGAGSAGDQGGAGDQGTGNQGAGSGGDQGTSAGGQGGGDQGGGDWTAGLSPDVRQALASKSYDSPDALGRAYLDLEKKIGADKIALPAADAPAEAWDPIYKALGRPDSAESYDLGAFKPPDGLPWSPEIQTGMVGEMHAAGLNSQQVTRLLGKYAELQNGEWTAYNEDAKKAADTSTDELKGEWGQGYDAKVDLGNRVVRHAFGDNLEAAKQLRLEDGSFVLDNPVMVRALAAIGESWAEDGALPQGFGDLSLTPAGAKTEIAKLKQDEAFQKAFLDGAHPEHAEAVQRMQRLKGLAEGGQS